LGFKVYGSDGHTGFVRGIHIDIILKVSITNRYMNRRTFIKTSAFSSIALGLGKNGSKGKTHILTLSFDDGFKKSYYQIAEIYEKYGLAACFNIIATGHFPDFQKIDDWILPELLGSFDDWNRLKARGHEIMPHSWEHCNLAKKPLDEAKDLVVKCLDYFEQNLEGFKSSEAVFNFPYNASTPELEEFTLSKVLGIRSGYIPDANLTPVTRNIFRKDCRSNGPDNIDDWVEYEVNQFLASDGGWLIVNLHGLDDEGWGPISKNYLVNLLKRLVQIETLEIAPTGRVLKRSASQK